MCHPQRITMKSAILMAAVAAILLCVAPSRAAATAAQHDLYKGYAVYRVWVESAEHAAVLRDLEELLNLDMWEVPRAVGTRDGIRARVMVAPEWREQLTNALGHHGLSHQLDVPDVASMLVEEDTALAQYRSTRTNRKTFEDFPRHQEVNDYLTDLAARHSDVATLVSAGPSYEGRDIKYLKLSTTNFADESKPVFFIDAMIHAREWVTTPTTLYALHRLLDEPGDLERRLLNDVDWIVLPVVNPDGYEHSHTADRLWRRTRSVNVYVDTPCLGVDANRNFDVEFNTTSGVSQDPCSQTYPGGAAFSEPETRYVRDLLLEHHGRLYFYMDIHSFGNYVLYPYGNGTLAQPATAAARLHVVGAAIGAAMDARKLPEAGYYLVGNGALMMYDTSGTAEDYAAQEGVPLAYTLELPGLGRGFQVPPEYIDHINRETWYGLSEAARLTKIFYDADRRST